MSENENIQQTEQKAELTGERLTPLSKPSTGKSFFERFKNMSTKEKLRWAGAGVAAAGLLGIGVVAMTAIDKVAAVQTAIPAQQQAAAQLQAMGEAAQQQQALQAAQAASNAPVVPAIVWRQGGQVTMHPRPKQALENVEEGWLAQWSHTGSTLNAAAGLEHFAVANPVLPNGLLEQFYWKLPKGETKARLHIEPTALTTAMVCATRVDVDGVGDISGAPTLYLQANNSKPIDLPLASLSKDEDGKHLTKFWLACQRANNTDTNLNPVETINFLGGDTPDHEVPVNDLLGVRVSIQKEIEEGKFVGIDGDMSYPAKVEQHDDQKALQAMNAAPGSSASIGYRLTGTWKIETFGYGSTWQLTNTSVAPASSMEQRKTEFRVATDRATQPGVVIGKNEIEISEGGHWVFASAFEAVSKPRTTLTDCRSALTLTPKSGGQPVQVYNDISTTGLRGNGLVLGQTDLQPGVYTVSVENACKPADPNGLILTVNGLPGSLEGGILFHLLAKSPSATVPAIVQ